MSNYDQYYYKGDTINARISEDGFALDLTDDKVRKNVYNDDYRSGLAKQFNSIYRRKFGHDSGISDNSISLEILGHAGIYDFATGLNGKVDKTAAVFSPVIFAAWDNPYTINKREEYYNRAKEANIGTVNDDQRELFDSLGKVFY